MRARCKTAGWCANCARPAGERIFRRKMRSCMCASARGRPPFRRCVRGQWHTTMRCGCAFKRVRCPRAQAFLIGITHIVTADTLTRPDGGAGRVAVLVRIYGELCNLTIDHQTVSIQCWTTHCLCGCGFARQHVGALLAAIAGAYGTLRSKCPRNTHSWSTLRAQTTSAQTDAATHARTITIPNVR